LIGHLPILSLVLALAQAGQSATGQTKPPPPPDPHAGHTMPAPPQKPAGLPEITEEDRRAAFPKVEGHAVHDRATNYFVLIDQMELQLSDGSAQYGWDARGWIGGDVNRFWFRSEGDHEGALPAAQFHLLYGRAFARWWDVTMGMRQDFGEGPAQAWAAVGIQGLAPQWFDVEATAYIGAKGRTHFRFEAEYQMLITNRLVLEPLVELEIYGKDDPEHFIGAGLSTVDAGLRLRYEIRREIAPYAGITWNWKFFGTADAARERNKPVSNPRFTIGLRTWF
jgi:copper resistance protein B